MPLLFAVTLFVSASLLFMVQPMVGKMVLPLLGGSPAVWNACMVFFQALLLLGYLYAHKLVSIQNPRKQWMIHMGVLLLPLTVFALAAMFSTRNSPIAIVEALAPSDERSPILSVLAILTVAIGIPFFVVSTTATLLQRWFVYTGHPSARDPYFLYAASNFGSLISLLGYPIFIEPRMPIVGQTWVFAVGFAILVGLIFLCGRAAANPIGVPPPSAQPNGGGRTTAEAKRGLMTSEPPPTLARKLKWIALAFVPSTLMLGVTFYITTDIASVPLLWVAPLSLYLITFIIAFGTIRGLLQLAIVLPAGFCLAVGVLSEQVALIAPGLLLGGLYVALHFTDWLGLPNMSLADSSGFRILIGNLAPVVILLLVFTMISDVDPGYGIRLLLHMIAFFAAALMCHYELARDRPAPQYLTEFFLLMSVGGVLGGVFNSLLAPLLFPHPWEYPIAIVVACLMVPKLIEEEEEETPVQPTGPTPRTFGEKVAAWLPFVGIVLNTAAIGIGLVLLHDRAPRPIELAPGITLEPMMWFYIIGGLFLSGIVSLIGVEIYGRRTRNKPGYARELWEGAPPVLRAAAIVLVNPLALPWAATSVLRTRSQFRLYLDLVIPVAVGMGFYALTLLPESERFLAACHGVYERTGLSVKTVALVTIYAVPVMLCFFFVDRPLRFALSVFAIIGPVTYRESTSELVHSERSFFGVLKIRERERVAVLRKGDELLKHPDGSPIIARRVISRYLHHGTTLHGTQFAYPPDIPAENGRPGESGRLQSRHILDDFQMIIPNVTAWNAVAVAATTHAYEIREEPLTYYHQTGPVGAMFAELWKHKGGTDAKAPFAMVGLGTGSVSCYARPGQTLTFYEIDPAVKHLVADTDEYFTYVTDARKRGANVEIHMGDARLKLKDDADRKYTLLLIDAFSSDAIPVHLLTVEAVRLYLDRMTDDGMLALHISNRWVNLEPVVAAIANELGLVARVWNDGSEGREGKTAASWIVLARKPEHLGGLNVSTGDLLFAQQPPAGQEDRQELSMDSQIFLRLLLDYDELRATGTKKEKYKEMNEVAGEGKPRQAWIDWTKEKLSKTTDPFQKQRLEQCLDLMTRYSPFHTFQEVMLSDHGHAFRRLETMPEVHAWTDDYSDVMRVMTIPEVRAVRNFFGLPTVK